MPRRRNFRIRLEQSVRCNRPVYLTEQMTDLFSSPANDLPVAKFCSQIEAEWLEIVGAAGSEGNEWLPGPVKEG